MKNRFLLLVGLAMLASAAVQASESERERKAMQAELDAACEAARQEKLIPLRAKFVEECVEKKERSDRASCERYYADYGNRTGIQNPLFYDLPECEKAHEYRTSYRRSGP